MLMGQGLWGLLGYYGRAIITWQVLGHGHSFRESEPGPRSSLAAKKPSGDL